MKLTTPDYYKDFKCIAGDCTDTCCAGWEVDVEPASYEYYKTVKGPFGDRLKSVMTPEEEGGCTFTLNKGRCPFLNQKNLCDLYIELGEDRLCDTCAEFPRFINEYGSVREMGIAPSCKTAGELIFGYEGKHTFVTEECDDKITTYNDIDPQTYFQLRQARKTAYALVQNRRWSITDRCMLLLEFASKIQKKLDAERDELIANVTKAFTSEEYCEQVLDRCHRLYGGTEKAYEAVNRYFDVFPGMEVINPDWIKYTKVQDDFMQMCRETSGAAAYDRCVRDFDAYYADRQFEYEQLMMYYVFRYFLDAVNDYDVLLKVKIGVIGYLVLRQLDVATWYANHGTLSKKEQVDLAHLYSRQFEHSYTNYAQYIEFFESKRCYSYPTLMKILAGATGDRM